MKGVSAIIATILMLIITIGLAATAYVYINDLLTGKTSTPISLIDYYCTPGAAAGDVTIVFSNDGSEDLDTSVMQVLADATPLDVATACDINPNPVPSHSTGVVTCSDALFATGNNVNVRVTSGTNSIRAPIRC